ncbi:hypothetical protein [Bacillus sp. BPN334]|uniref:hypothetical protein n=1 Tax=Bacillus sp. BPN334 TaxID=2217815 RepID=UPI0011ECE0AF|nr:hypothetical protein [Bacillus sp. BPN334]KAA0794817.1 hypothetical protein DN393_00030 [Bacillus sp. BPN334]
MKKINFDTLILLVGFIFLVMYSFWASGRSGEEVISGLKMVLWWIGFVLVIVGTISIGIIVLGKIQKRSSKE